MPEMSDKAFVLYDPDGRGLLVAVVYRILKNNDIAGWFYGHVGSGEYDSAYFCITRDGNLEPTHFYAGRAGTEWDRDYQMTGIWLGVSGTIFITPELQEQLQAIQRPFAQRWLYIDEQSGFVYLNTDRVKTMQIEEDDSYSYASLGLDLDILNYIASKWPLNTPLSYYQAKPVT